MLRVLLITVLVSLFSCHQSKDLSKAYKVLLEARNSERVKKYAQIKLDGAETAYSKAKSNSNPDNVYIAHRKAEIALEYAGLKETEEKYAKSKNDFDSNNAALEKAKDDEIAKLKKELEEKDRMLKEKEEQWAKAKGDLEEAIKGLGELRKEERGLVLYISDILFDFDKATLKEVAKSGLLKVAKALSDFPQYKILVEGHTDSVGSDEYNQRLSERRASSVGGFIIGHGVGANRLSTKGLGEARPRANNSTSEGRQQNRRVEIVISE